MAVGPDFRSRAGAADEGIVGRHAAVAGDTDHLAEVVRQVLRLTALVAFAEAEPQHPVTADHHAAAQMVASAGPGQNGSAWCRVRVWQYGLHRVELDSFKKKNK